MPYGVHHSSLLAPRQRRYPVCSKSAAPKDGVVLLALARPILPSACRNWGGAVIVTLLTSLQASTCRWTVRAPEIAASFHSSRTSSLEPGHGKSVSPVLIKHSACMLHTSCGLCRAYWALSVAWICLGMLGWWWET